MDDADSNSAFIIRPVNIFYSVISSCAVYLHAFLMFSTGLVRFVSISARTVLCRGAGSDAYNILRAIARAYHESKVEKLLI